MNRRTRLALLAAFLCVVLPAAADEQPVFDALFTDHAVLQRDQEIRVWGSAEPGSEVELALGGEKTGAVADRAGRWLARFPARPAGGPYTLELRSGQNVAQILQDVMVGEVWLCSGQSNMAYRVGQMNDRDREASNAPSNIRLLTVGRDNRTRPQTAFGSLDGWHVANTETLMSFSAACYLFARARQAGGENVPFGLINASWGGSAIEAWISADGLRTLGGFDRNLDLVEQFGDDPAGAMAAFTGDWQDWWLSAVQEAPPPWDPDYDDGDWRSAPAALGDWQQWRNSGTAGFTGMVWFRRTFELTPEQAAGGAVLELGGVDELDVTWVNGRAVGTRFGWGDPRRYTVPAGVLRAGTNSLAVNVYNSWGAGGLYGPAEAMRLALADGSNLPLGDGWKFHVVPPERGSPPKAPWESITGLTGLYNAMVAPLRGFGLGGVLWYQGESNTGRPYAGLLRALVGDWRVQLGAQLPFLVVQLPNFGGLPQAPTDSGWARLRHDQQRVALSDPLTGLVVTLDSADRTDLHPPNKRIVGERAAAVARGLLDGGNETVDGIAPLGATRGDETVVVAFGTAGLRVAGAASAAGFELCGPNGECRYVDAEVEGDRVVLDAATVPDAIEVRYAWADAPLVSLFDGDGLPVGSFRLAIESR